MKAQATAALEDGKVAAIKLGMLGTKELLETVSELVAGPLINIPLVVDPNIGKLAWWASIRRKR